jgi:tripeptidyl-peptidase II
LRLLPALALVVVLVSPPRAFAAELEDYSDLLSLDVTGAAAFVRAHPESDGRGVVVAVLDTGVDPTLPGLRTTSEGKPKVIAARDFSGEGDVKLEELPVSRTGKGWETEIDGRKILVPKGSVSSVVSDRIWGAVVSEGLFAGTASPDVNGNGGTEDRFDFLVLRDKDLPGAAGWLVLVDSDANGEVDGKGVRPFEVGREVLYLSPARAKAKTPRLPITVHVRSEGPHLELHSPAGSHGTHVAAIAAGYGILGRKGFNGVAPGASIISLKIGHNALAGGATTSDSMRRALEHAAWYSRVHKVPVVANVSYGIGSETEGSHEIETFLDELLARTPSLSVVVSAGNEGPGLSTVGQPAGARLATTLGAGFTGRQAGPLLGHARDGGVRPFFFTSRGGELAKPELLAPGIALASVPDYDPYPVKAGTSMASPLVAGLSALLWSYAGEEGFAKKITHGEVKSALMLSAEPIKDTLHATQGVGVPYVVKAADLLEERSRGAGKRPLGLAVEVDDRRHPGRPAQAVYWRLAADPDPRDALQVKVRAILPAWWSAETKARYFSRLKLRGLPRWASASRSSAALKGGEAASFALRLLKDRVPRNAKGEGEALAWLETDDGMKVPFLLLWVRPHARVSGNLVKGPVAPLEVLRRYVEVPAAASSVAFVAELEQPKKGGAQGSGVVYLLLHDPEGRGVEHRSHRLRWPDSPRARLEIPADDLLPGIWELDLYGHHRNPGSLQVRVDLEISRAEPVLLEDAIRDGDGPLELSFDLRSAEQEPRWLSLGGRVEGVLREDHLSDTGDRLTWSFNTISKRPVRLRVDLDEATWSRVTDVAVRITGPGGGEPVLSDAMSQRLTTFVFHPGAVGEHKLVMDFGLTVKDEREVSGAVALYLPFAADLPLSLTGSALDAPLYPGVSREITVRTTGAPQAPGDIGLLYGEIQLEDRSTGRPWHRIEIKVPAQ